MTSVFDGLDAIFTAPDVFGEPVVYTPKATGVPLGADGTITAVWIEAPGFVVQGEAGTDTIEMTLHVSAAIVTPVEGDTVQRVKTGKTCGVVTPIRPDGQGMIAAALEAMDRS